MNEPQILLFRKNYLSLQLLFQKKVDASIVQWIEYEFPKL